MIAFRTKWSLREEAIVGELNNLPSLTQPDEVMSISEMLARHARGLPVHASRFGEGVYLDENLGYVPDPREMDLVEIHEKRDQFKARYDELQALENKEKKSKKEKAEYERLKKVFDVPDDKPAPDDPPSDQ